MDQTSATYGYRGANIGANSLTDGETNTNRMPNSQAANWCRAKGSTWYLPALNELLAIFNNIEILNSALSETGGIQINTTDSYLSSTEGGTLWARQAYFSGGKPTAPGSSSDNKNTSYKVRAVRKL